MHKYSKNISSVKPVLNKVSSKDCLIQSRHLVPTDSCVKQWIFNKRLDISTKLKQKDFNKAGKWFVKSVEQASNTFYRDLKFEWFADSGKMLDSSSLHFYESLF